MKSLAFAFLALSLLTVSAAHASSCSDSVKQAVEQQAKTDFPNQSLTAVVPAFDFDGGRVQTLDVPVVDSANATVATYDVMIDEVCSVEIQPRD